MPHEQCTAKEVRAFFDSPDWDKTKSIALKLALAGLGTGATVSLLGELSRRLKKPPIDTAPDDMGSISISLPKRLHRRRLKQSADEKQGAKNWLEHPAAIPAITLSGLGGLLGGYYGTEWAVDKLRKKETEDDLEAARKEFEDAIQASLMKRKKAASDAEECGQEVERIFNDLTKMAEDGKKPGILGVLGSKLQRAWGSAEDATRLYPEGPSMLSPGLWGGAGLAGGGLLWALIHSMAKKHFDKGDPERLKMKALERMQRLRYATTPPPITFETEM
jgi:hypothetical protein